MENTSYSLQMIDLKAAEPPILTVAGYGKDGIRKELMGREFFVCLFV